MSIENEELQDRRVKTFIRKLIGSIWKHTLRVWKSHNDINHESDTMYSIRDRRLLKECVLRAYDL